MPIFRTTENILKDRSAADFFDPNWMDSNNLMLPPSPKWDYSRELKIEDVDIWEVLLESGPYGIYAAWCPYAEFYLCMMPSGVETFYGAGAQASVQKLIKDHNIPYGLKQVWVEPEDMWLYE